MHVLKALFSPDDFMPHGYCYLWKSSLVWLHVVSDALIALAYLAIPIILVYFIRKRRDLPFNWMFACFGVFILACGATHAMEVWNLWHANYWLAGGIKAVTAVASIGTAILLVQLLPRALALPSPEAMRLEIAARRRAQDSLNKAKAELEMRVNERTAELMKKNEELRQSEERFRLLIESVQDYAIFMLGPTGLVTSWNAGAERIKGYRAEEIVGQHFSRFFLPDDLERDEPNRELQVTAAEGRFETEGWRVRRDGSRFWANVVLTSLRDQTGKLVGFSKITRNLTERRRAEESLQDAKAELARMARVTSMGELTASIAHEINQPLSAIVNNANACSRLLAVKSPDLEEVRQAVADISDAGTRAGEIISRIRAFFRKAVPSKTPLDINQIIEEVLALTVAELKRHDICVETELTGGLARVLGDRIELQQVVLNLIMNGVDAMASVKDRPRMLLIRSQAHDPGSLSVAVQDSGMGLSPGIIDQVFERFFTTKPHGMGMGLSISRSIVEAHGGKLWPVPNHGQGAIFQFTLPAAA
jgi:PAS domain S-box-containing protein